MTVQGRILGIASDGRFQAASPSFPPSPSGMGMGMGRVKLLVSIGSLRGLQTGDEDCSQLAAFSTNGAPVKGRKTTEKPQPHVRLTKLLEADLHLVNEIAF
jgi:hypothetical protein